MDRTEEDALKRHERPRRQLNSHFLPKPLKQGDGPSHGEGAGGKKYHANGPSPSLLGSSVNDFECFGRKTKIENWLQFSIFNF